MPKTKEAFSIDADIFRDPQKEAIAKRLKKMDPAVRAGLTRLAKPRIVEPYTKHIPHPAQQVFLSLQGREAMYGGAAGGGKSDALLMAALQYVDVPGYSALILRRTWPDLNAPGAILDRARTWLHDTDARQKDGGRIWTFPGGGRIQFGYMQHDKDKYKFQSAEYQFIGFDELTHFEEGLYTYMFSRNRRPDISCLNCATSLRRYRNKVNGTYWKHTTSAGAKCKQPYPDPAVLKQYSGSMKDGKTLFDVPLRMRSATNPGGIGHIWVRDRFIDDRTKVDGAIFVPARLTDNPSLDQESYRDSLEHLLPVDRERLLNGDWDVQEEGNFFNRQDFNPVNEAPRNAQRVRFWDMAATQDGGDYTVGVLLAAHDGRYTIEDVVRFQHSPPNTEKIVYQTAMMDRAQYGQGLVTLMEQEPGSAGVTAISHYGRNVLNGFAFRGVRSSGDKQTRATPVASAVAAGNVDMKVAEWNRDFLDEAVLFPNGAHDDQVDALSGGLEHVAFGRRSRIIA